MPRVAQAPPPGIVRNATPDATAGRWYDCNGVRFRQGQAQPIGGNVAIPGTAVTDMPRDMLCWHDNSHVRWTAFGTDSKLYAYRFDTQLIYDITPTGVGALDPPGAAVGYGLGNYSDSTYGTARDPADIGPQDPSALLGDMWSLATFGELLLIVPTQQGSLYVWDPTTPAAVAVVVPEAPTLNRAVVVTDQRSVVLLGAGGDPRNIAWSDTENIHVWTPDITNLAGSKLLATQATALMAVKISQGVLIFTNNDVHLMAYAGPPYAYGILQIGWGCGPVSLRAVVASGSFVMWPGLQTFWAFNGNVQPAPSDVQDWFFSLLNRAYAGRVFGSPNPAFGEIFWDWPDQSSQECNRYIAVNYSDPNHPWTIGVRSRTAGDPAGTLDYPILGGPNATNTGGSLYFHEFSGTDNGIPRGANGQIYLESGSISLGEGDRRMNVTQVVMDSVPPSGALGMRFFVLEQPGSSNEFDTGLYTATHDGLLDVRFSGRTVRMRVEALDDNPWALGRLRLEVRPGGKR